MTFCILIYLKKYVSFSYFFALSFLGWIHGLLQETTIKRTGDIKWDPERRKPKPTPQPERLTFQHHRYETRKNWPLTSIFHTTGSSIPTEKLLLLSLILTFGILWIKILWQ